MNTTICLECGKERKKMKIGQPLRVIEAVPVPVTEPSIAPEVEKPEKETVEENV
jgi:hypothetical protein